MSILIFEIKKVLRNRLFLVLLILIPLSIGIYSNFFIQKSETYNKVDYQKVISKKIEDATNTSTSSFFGSDKYAQRSAVISINMYKNLQDINIQQDELFFYKEMLNGMISIFVVAITALASYLLFIKEKNEGKLLLTSHTLKGGIRNALIRQLTVFLIGCFSAIFFLIIYFFIGTVKYGFIIFEQLSLPIQQIEWLIWSPFKISVGELIFYVIFMEVVLAYVLSLTFSILSVIKSQLTYFLLVIGFILGIELMLNYFIIEKSNINILKYLNIWVLMLPSNLFSSFHTMNICGYSILTIYVSAIFFIILIVVLQVVFLFLVKKQIPISDSINWKRKKKYSFNLNPVLFEIKKLLFTEKAIWVLICFISVSVYLYNGYNENMNKDDYYYRYYSEVLLGETSQDKENFIKVEDKRFSDIIDKINVANEKFTAGQIDLLTHDLYLQKYEAELIGQKGFNKSKYQYETLIQEGKNIYMYQDAFKKLFKIDMVHYLIVIAFFLITTIRLYSIENENAMNKLITSSYIGFKKVNKIKKKVALIFIVLMYIFMVILDFVVKLIAHKISGFMYPSSSLLFLKSSMFIDMPIIATYLIKYIIIGCIFVFIANFIIEVNKRYNNGD